MNRIDEGRLANDFLSAGIRTVSIETREFPQEMHYIVYVAPADLDRALIASSKMSSSRVGGLDAFVIVRSATPAMIDEELSSSPQGPVRNVHDLRCSELINLVSARSRVSDAQPSLAYVPDARANMAAVTAARHHLIFGRRGAGKTALLVEARGRLNESGSITAWANIQTLRRESSQRVVLYVLDRIFTALSASRAVPQTSKIAVAVSTLSAKISDLLGGEVTSPNSVHRLVPEAQDAIRNYLHACNSDLYVFLDDFYYLRQSEQPEALDILHSCVRDARAWLKVASIKHLTRWWQASPPAGLQSGQDADLIDLDLTLQSPAEAKRFLEGVLLGFANAVGIPALSRVFRPGALDRLVIASGAVPRDYLVLATSAIGRAQRRQNARLVGVQEVNQAAGDAASSKVHELEEDMASNVGSAGNTLSALRVVRKFCLDEEAFTYFLVGFRDREAHPEAYTLLTELMDVRLIHLVDAGVSDAHAAGRRSEAYMLDLSQYSGARLKQKVRVLDFADGSFISRETRPSTSSPTKVGKTPLQLIAILRRAPTLELTRLQDGVTHSTAATTTGNNSQS